MGVYRIYDASGGLLYVGKARDLRRRLAQHIVKHWCLVSGDGAGRHTAAQRLGR